MCSMTGSSATGHSSVAMSRSSACPRRWNRWLSTTAPFPGSIRTGRLPDRHGQTAPLPDPDHAHESRSDRLRLITLSTGRVRAASIRRRGGARCGRPATSSAGGAVSGGSRSTPSLRARRAAADPRHGRDVAGQPAPDDLRATAAGVDFLAQPFVPLYRTDDEFAAELSNRNIHAVMHLAWARPAAITRARWPSTSNPAAGSAPPKWPLSSPSVTSSSTRHSRATSTSWNRRVPRPSEAA